MQQCGSFDRLELFFFVDAHSSRELHRVALNAPNMTMRNLVFRIDAIARASIVERYMSLSCDTCRFASSRRPIDVRKVAYEIRSSGTMMLRTVRSMRAA